MTEYVIVLQRRGYRTRMYKACTTWENLPKEGEDFKVNGIRANTYLIKVGCVDGKAVIAVYANQLELKTHKEEVDTNVSLRN